jgi:hypothetical protein
VPALNADITNNSRTSTRIPERSRTSERADAGRAAARFAKSFSNRSEHRYSSPNPWKQQRESSEQRLKNS